MKKWFICPDGEQQEIDKCLDGECRLHERCCPSNYLQSVADEREWTGKPSVTQLLNGTRLEFLKLTTDYAENPIDSAFRILGTKAHTSLESIESQFSFTEEKMETEHITGISDLLEQQTNGDWWLIDYKTSGSYKVALAIGVKMIPEPILDYDGNIILYKTGDKKGQPKTKKIPKYSPDYIDIFDWEMQLNMYRIMAEQELNEKIAKMKIFCIVRDGKTHIAESRGITEPTYYIDIKHLDNNYVLDYFKEKRDRLIYAVDNNYLPDICTPQERWNGRRCELCPVSLNCDKGD